MAYIPTSQLTPEQAEKRRLSQKWYRHDNRLAINQYQRAYRARKRREKMEGKNER